MNKQRATNKNVPTANFFETDFKPLYESRKMFLKELLLNRNIRHEYGIMKKEVIFL